MLTSVLRANGCVYWYRLISEREFQFYCLDNKIYRLYIRYILYIRSTISTSPAVYSHYLNVTPSPSRFFLMEVID